MNGLDRQTVTFDNARLVHQARTVRPYDVFGSRIDMPPNPQHSSGRSGSTISMSFTSDNKSRNLL